MALGKLVQIAAAVHEDCSMAAYDLARSACAVPAVSGIKGHICTYMYTQAAELGLT